MNIFITLSVIFWSLFPSLLSYTQDSPLPNKVYLQNLINNGAFIEGTNGWLSSVSTSVVNNYNLINTSNGNANIPYVSYLGSLVVNDDYYINIKNRVLTTDCLTLLYKLDNNIGYKSISNPVPNQWYINSDIIKATTTNMTARFHHTYLDNAISNGKQMEIDYVYLFNVSQMKLNGIMSDNGVLFSNMSNGDIETQLDNWVLQIPNGYNSYYLSTFINDNYKWFTTGFVEKTGERDFIDYLGFFVWLAVPPISLYLLYKLIKGVIYD